MQQHGGKDHQHNPDNNAEDAWTPLLVLLREVPALPQPLQQRVLCKLLCTSAGLRDAARAHLAGRVSLRFSTYSLERLRAFVPWLARHGGLLAALALELNLTNSCWHEAEAAVGTALQQAGSSAAVPCGGGGGGAGGCRGGTWFPPPPGLQLRSYCSHPAVAGAVLDQLDSYYLTQLELGRHAAYSCGFALEGLTRLARLTLFEDSADALLPSLGGLAQLTRLALVDVPGSSMAKLASLPGQLLELQLSLARLRRSEAPPPGLRLGHLTALTRLTNGEGKPLLVQAGDELPPRLAVLHVRDCLDVAPLLGLTGLRALHMCASSTPAAGLRRLASVGGVGLQQVSLCYGDMGAAAAAAPAWPCLPLTSLELRAAEGALPAQTLDALGQLARLRRLDVYGGQGSFAAAAVLEATLGALAEAVRHMTSLEVLGLRGVGLLADSCSPCSSTAPAPPAAAAADTPPACGCAGRGAKEAGAAAAAAAAAQEGDTQPIAADQAAAAAVDSCGAALDGLHVSATRVTITDASSSTSGGSSGSGACGAAASQAGGASASSSCAPPSLLPLCEAVAALPCLACLTVASLSRAQQPLVVDEAAAAALARARRLTSLHLSDVGLTDGAANALVAAPGGGGSAGGGGAGTGLAASLQRLVLDSNGQVTGGALPDELASRLVRLRELGVLRTGIRADAEAFKARMLALHPGLHVKSSAR